MKNLTYLLIVVSLVLTSCAKSTSSGKAVAKPRYHHTWYKNHVYKKKWHVGRIKFEPEKQGTKKVKMKG